MGVLQKILLAIIRPFLSLFLGIVRMALFVAVLAIAALVFWRGALEAGITNSIYQMTGIDAEIEGGVDVSLDDGLLIVAHDIVAENPDWAVRDNMLKIDTMAVKASPVSMFFGQTYISDLTIDGLSLALEKGAEGAGGVANYTPALGNMERTRTHMQIMPFGGTGVVVEKFRLSNTAVFMRDGDRAVEYDIPILTGRFNPPGSNGGLALDTVSIFAGGSDVTASLLLSPGPKRMQISGNVTSRMLDITRFLPRVPMPPGANATDLPQTVVDTRQLADYMRANTAYLMGADLDVRLDIDNLRLPEMVATDIHAVLRSEAGMMSLRDVSARDISP